MHELEIWLRQKGTVRFRQAETRKKRMGLAPGMADGNRGCGTDPHGKMSRFGFPREA
jgi:hypothetical protein